MNSTPIIVRILSVKAVERPVKMRLPFQFGDTVVRETVEAFAKIAVQVNGNTYTGVSAQLMVPRWFDKRADQSNQDTVNTLRETIKLACKSALGMGGTVASICADIRSQVIGEMSPGTPQLAAGFGPALIEMALIDAVCRAADCNFFMGARHDLFGLANMSFPDLAPSVISQGLSQIEERWHTEIRHTIGHDAPLRAGDVNGDPNDGLPVALEDVIRTTGVKAFKIKIKGDIDSDLNRLMEIAPLFGNAGNFRITLDANEQYTKDAFAEFLKGFRTERRLQDILAATLFVEQPFPREIALETSVSGADFFLPMIIDESDDNDGSFATAWKMGWRGTSVKSCKGVLRSLLNYCRVKNFTAHGQTAVLSGEDLTCQPGLCLQQDTIMATAVGVQHAERNGHHFAGGMQGASQREIGDMLQAHPDLYEIVEDRVGLRIDSGRINFVSLQGTGFGSDQLLDQSRNRKIFEN